MTTDQGGTDRAVGIALAFGTVATLAAGGMLFLGDQTAIAWAFAAAMVAAVGAVGATQAYAD